MKTAFSRRGDEVRVPRCAATMTVSLLPARGPPRVFSTPKSCDIHVNRALDLAAIEGKLKIGPRADPGLSLMAVSTLTGPGVTV